MMYQMKLKEQPFENIKKGKKKIEFRLCDEKRKQLKLGDKIEFRKLPEIEEKIVVEVIGLLHYPSFYELFSDLAKELLEYTNETIEEMVEKMHTYYTEEEEKDKGVLGIRIKVIERG